MLLIVSGALRSGSLERFTRLGPFATFSVSSLGVQLLLTNNSPMILVNYKRNFLEIMFSVNFVLLYNSLIVYLVLV